MKALLLTATATAACIVGGFALGRVADSTYNGPTTSGCVLVTPLAGSDFARLTPAYGQWFDSNGILIGFSLAEDSEVWNGIDCL